MQISPPRNAINHLRRTPRSSPYSSPRPKPATTYRSPLASAQSSRKPVPEPESEVSIIVTSWDDDSQCWYPVEVFGPIGRELKAFVERRRREMTGGHRSIEE